MEFDSATANTWLVSSILAFVLDLLLYHSVGIFVRSSTQFASLLAAGSDGSTISRSVGKVLEQIRWLYINVYPYGRT